MIAMGWSCGLAPHHRSTIIFYGLRVELVTNTALCEPPHPKGTK